jgi:hypothetical protein
MARKRKRRNRHPGSANRPQTGAGSRWHNCPNGKPLDVCGVVMRIGGMLVEIPKSVDKTDTTDVGFTTSAEESADNPLA